MSQLEDYSSPVCMAYQNEVPGASINWLLAAIRGLISHCPGSIGHTVINVVCVTGDG